MSRLADDYHFVPAGSDGSGAVIAAQLRQATDSGTPAVVADLTRTTFCSAAGFRTLLQARQHAASRNVRFELACSSAAVLRVHHLLGLSGRLPVYPSVGTALMPAYSGQPY